MDSILILPNQTGYPILIQITIHPLSNDGVFEIWVFIGKIVCDMNLFFRRETRSSWWTFHSVSGRPLSKLYDKRHGINFIYVITTGHYDITTCDITASQSAFTSLRLDITTVISSHSFIAIIQYISKLRYVKIIGKHSMLTLTSYCWDSGIIEMKPSGSVHHQSHQVSSVPVRRVPVEYGAHWVQSSVHRMALDTQWITDGHSMNTGHSSGWIVYHTVFRRQQLCCVSYCIHSGDTDLLLVLLLLLVHLLAGTLSGSSKVHPSINTNWENVATNTLNTHFQMHYAVSDVVLQQEAHV